jgi:serine protease Do
LPDNPQQQASVKPSLSNRLKLKVVDDPEVEEGVKVEEVEEGPAASAGIQSGDIIMRLNNQQIENAEQFEETVKQLPTGKPFPILVQRGDGALFLALTLPPQEEK